MAVTIRDVAKLSGTSISAVSAVLGGRQHNIRVSLATQERIRAAAAQLGYSANPVARALVTRRAGALGLVFPYSGAFVDRNPFCMQVMSGVFEGVVSEKYNLLLHTAVGDDWNLAQSNALLDPRVDGLIIVIPPKNSPVVERCIRKDFPVVTIVHEAPSPELCTVNADEFEGGRLAARHLISLGHRRIAHLVGSERIASTEPRKKGFLTQMIEAGIGTDPRLTVSAGYSRDGGYAAIERLLELPAAERPTAVFAANDLCGHGALTRAQELGVSVPDDLAVVGFDDTWFAEMSRPTLTSVHMPIAEMGALAARMLIALVEGRQPPERQPVLPVSLTVRESCGALPTRRTV